MEISLQKHSKKEAENLRRGHKARVSTNQTRMKSFGRFLESGRSRAAPWSRPQTRNPFWQKHFSFLLSFSDGEYTM
jgi:hypothetical protein